MEGTRTVSTCKNVNQKQYHILGGIVKSSATTKALNVAEVVVSTTYLFSSPIWRVHRTAGSWIMTVDFYKSDYVVTPVTLLFQMWFCCLSKSIHFPVPGIQLLIWQMPFPSTLVEKDCQKEFNSTGKASNTFSLSKHRIEQLFSPMS